MHLAIIVCSYVSTHNHPCIWPDTSYWSYVYKACNVNFLQVNYSSVGKIKVNSLKLGVAAKAANPFKMARKLLPEFFSVEELSTYTCAPPKPGAKVKRPQADTDKLKLLLGELITDGLT